MDEVERALTAAAADLNQLGLTPELEVLVDVRWRGPYRLQGLCAYNLWTDVFEPARKRWLLGRRWRAVQPPEEVARRMRWFLANRPDLPPDERPAGWEPRT